MRFMRFVMFDASKTHEVAAASDKVWKNPPAGIKILASYICLGLVFPGTQSTMMVAIQIIEAESTEAMAATTYPISLAGAMTWDVPLMELPVGASAEEEVGKRNI